MKILLECSKNYAAFDFEHNKRCCIIIWYTFQMSNCFIKSFDKIERSSEDTSLELVFVL